MHGDNGFPYDKSGYRSVLASSFQPNPGSACNIGTDVSVACLHSISSYRPCTLCDGMNIHYAYEENTSCSRHRYYEQSYLTFLRSYIQWLCHIFELSKT
ncbi:hypothetical protein TNCV_1578481 [Trichonephila clavipes]|nr:hypothetical protein TNCV_1578481 [Trichonephila clavipes]